MTEQGKKEILWAFPYYLSEWDRLDRAHGRLHSWQWIKDWQILRAKGKLNRWYEGKMRSWGL